MAVNNELGSVNDLVLPGASSGEKSESGIPFGLCAGLSQDRRSGSISKRRDSTRSISVRKIHGPKGIRRCTSREGVRIPPLLLGGGQERGMRSGTENLPLAAGASAAAAKDEHLKLEELQLRSSKPPSGGAFRIGDLRMALEDQPPTSSASVSEARQRRSPAAYARGSGYLYLNRFGVLHTS